MELGNRTLRAAQSLSGPLVPVMPAFHADERLDLESTCRWVEWLISQGIRGFWTTYGTSHYLCLTDDEIVELNRAVAAVTRGRAVFIASTNFGWPIERCLEFIRSARAWGVDMVKLQIDWRWNPKPDLVFSFYERIARETVLPLFGYTLAAPGIKGMSRELLGQIMALRPFVGIKNDSGDFYEQCDYLRGVRLARGKVNIVTGGTLSSFLHSQPFGARAYATSVGVVFPSVALTFDRLVRTGRRAAAVKLVQQCEEPLYELFAQASVSHWSCLHTLLVARGLFGSDTVRFPLGTATAKERAAARRLLKLRSLREG